MARIKMLFEDSDGWEYVDVERGSEEASAIGAYWHAVAAFQSDDIPHNSHYETAAEELQSFENLEINGRFAMTDLDYIEELANEGEIDFEDIYE